MFNPRHALGGDDDGVNPTHGYDDKSPTHGISSRRRKKTSRSHRSSRKKSHRSHKSRRRGIFGLFRRRRTQRLRKRPGRHSAKSGKIFYAKKTGQPYILLSNGRAKFIKGKRHK